MDAQLWSAIGEAFLIVGGFTVVFVGGFVVASILIIRRKAKGKMVAIFIEATQQETEELVEVTSDGTFKSQHKDNNTDEEEEEYFIDPAKLTWSRWPKGLPIWMQEIVPTSHYIRNQADPFHHKNHTSITTAKTLRYVKDEGMLRATWKDAQEAIEGSPKGIKNPMLILGAIVVIGFVVIGYLAFTVLEMLTSLDVFIRSIA